MNGLFSNDKKIGISKNFLLLFYNELKISFISEKLFPFKLLESQQQKYKNAFRLS